MARFYIMAKEDRGIFTLKSSPKEGAVPAETKDGRTRKKAPNIISDDGLDNTAGKTLKGAKNKRLPNNDERSKKKSK